MSTQINGKTKDEDFYYGEDTVSEFLKVLISRFLVSGIMDQIAKEMNEHIFEQKLTIMEEDVMQLAAFFLSTGINKMEEIDEYFEVTPFLRTNLISKELFQFLCLTLKDNSNITKFK